MTDAVSQWITTWYAKFVVDLCGETVPLQYGQGCWLERISGKEVLHAIAGLCFKVRAMDGSTLQGKTQLKEIAKGLLLMPLAEQPADFQALVSLLQRRLS